MVSKKFAALSQAEKIAFEKKVIEIAKIDYPGRTNFSSTQLDPIREALLKNQGRIQAEATPKTHVPVYLANVVQAPVVPKIVPAKKKTTKKRTSKKKK